MTTPQPLWSDDRIEDFANAKYDASEYFEVFGAMVIVRDDYEHELAAARARMAALEAALAERGEWEPVPQEEPFNSQGDYVMGTGQGLAVWLQCSVASAVWHGVPLGENIRLMRRVAGAKGEQL